MLSNKKASVKNNITLEQWKVYFERLFEYNGELNEQDIINIFEEEPVLDDVEDFIFNSEITEEEILRVVRALKQAILQVLTVLSPVYLLTVSS